MAEIEDHQPATHTEAIIPLIRHPSGFQHPERVVARLAEALGRLARVMRGRVIDEWGPLFELSEVTAIEEAAIAGDRQLHVLDRARQADEEREREDEARDENTRGAVKKFVGWGEFLRQVCAEQDVDLAWWAQEFYRQLRMRRGTITLLLPFIGLLPTERRSAAHLATLGPGAQSTEFRITEAVRLIRLREEAVEYLFRLLAPGPLPLPPAALVGLYAIEIARPSHDPSDWQEGTPLEAPWKSIAERTYPQLGPFFLARHGRALFPVMLFESSSRLVDGPTPRVTTLWPEDRDLLRLTPDMQDVQHTTLDDLGAEVAELADAFARVRDATRAHEALRYFTMGKLLLLLRQLHHDPDEEAALAAKALFYRSLGALDPAHLWMATADEEFDETWTLADEVWQVGEHARAELAAWLRRNSVPARQNGSVT